MWQDRSEKNSIFCLFHTFHPTKEQSMVLGNLLDCLQYHHKVTKTSLVILDVSDGSSVQK